MARELKFRAWVEWTETPRFEYSERHYPDTFWGNYDEGDNVEQYTGLTDKNGKEVYEGDIIKYDGIVYTIVWNEEYMGFDLTRVGNMHLGVPMNVIITCGSVIGNIHENPELLGDKK